MFDLNMLYDAKFVRVSDAVAAGQTTVTTSVVDMKGYTSVAFLAVLGTVTSTGVSTLTAKSNTANSTSGTAVKTSTTTAATTDNSNGMLLLDINRPSQEYVFATLDRTTANVAVDGIFAILYNAGEHPVTQDTTTLVDSAFAADEI